MMHQVKLHSKIAIVVLLFSVTTTANAQTVLQGTITGADNRPLIGAAVHLEPSGKNTLTDSAGHYRLTGVKSTSCTLDVSAAGYQQKTVTVACSGTAVIRNVRLVPANHLINEVTINAAHVIDHSSVYVAKLPLKNVENPQVYHVVDQKLMTQQDVIKIDEALKNVPGTIVNNTTGGYLSLTSRGFNTYVSARNGMSVASWFTSYDPANIERIEVLKGPSGTLYQGAASYGGAVNIVTKKPDATPHGRFAFNAGSWGLNRASLDLNQPLDKDKRFLFRINGSGDREKTFQDLGHSNVYTLSPSVRYIASDRLTLDAELELYYSEKTPVAWQSFGDFVSNVADIPVYEKSYYADDLATRLSRQNGTFTAKYELSDHFISTTVISVANASVYDNYFCYNYFISPDSFRQDIYAHSYNYYSTNVQQNFTGDFKLLGLRNRLVAGLEYFRTNFDYAGYYVANLDTMSVHEFFPIMRKHVDKALQDRLTQSFPGSWIRKRYAVYASDLISLRSNLMVMLSLRLDHYHYSRDETSQIAFSPKLGLVYQPVKDRLALFVNCNDGFSNTGTAKKSDGTIVALDPEHATQWEGGMKWSSVDHRYSATLSYYNIRIHNATMSDDEGWFLSQDGVQRSRGAEVEWIAQPTDELFVLAGYGYNENKYIKWTNEGFVGNLAGNAPQHIFNFWTNYRLGSGLLEGLSLGIGGNYVDEVFTDAYNRTIVPAYLVLNTVLAYKPGKFGFTLKVNNLTNQRYYSGPGIPQPLRQLVFGASFRF